MSPRSRLNPQSDSCGRGRRGGIAPIGGATLLVLVTLVLATGHRDTLPVRQAIGEARWAEPANGRDSSEAESRPTAPTKPSAAKFVGIGPSQPRAVLGLVRDLTLSTLATREAIAAQRLVRIALLNLPPPRS